MKISVLALAVTAGATIAAQANATVLANWTFETSNPATAGPFAAEAGVNGATSQASGSHASGATVYSSPVGNGSARSFSSNTWAVNDYYQFKSSSLGYSNIKIQWDQTSSNTGPRDFGLFWSTNGTTFTQIGSTLTVLANAAPNPVWNAVTASALFTMGPTSGPAAMDNQATIYFRVVMLTTVSANGGTVAAAGTSRVDNVIITGDVVPTPGSAALIGLAGLIAGRRRRN